MSIIAASNESFVTFYKSPELSQALRDLKIFVGIDNNFSLIPGDLITFPSNAIFGEYIYFEGVNFVSSLGFASYTHSNCSDIRVGRYCSIAQGLQIMGMRHPIERTTSSGLTYDRAKPHYRAIYEDFGIDRNLISYPDKPLLSAETVIENDVWVGMNVTLARGIRLGTGCVVAAGAVVTKDVPPYAIVGGNPARIIRDRFSQEVISALLESEWWELHPSIISCDLSLNPENFISKMKSADYKKYEFRMITVQDILQKLEKIGALLHLPPAISGDS